MAGLSGCMTFSPFLPRMSVRRLTPRWEQRSPPLGLTAPAHQRGALCSPISQIQPGFRGRLWTLKWSLKPDSDIRAFEQVSFSL